MKNPKVYHGKRIKKWVVVAEAEKIGSKRRFVLKCLACGATKNTTVDKLAESAHLANCNCKREIPAELPKYNGTACNCRITALHRCASGLNHQGFCCYWCPEKEDCLDECLNTPDKCGCFNKDPKKIAKHREIAPDRQQEVMCFVKDIGRGGV